MVARVNKCYRIAVLTSSGHLEAGDRLEVHHLQHLLGLGIDLDDILETKGVKQLPNINYTFSENSISSVSRPLNMHTTWRCE